MLGARQTHTTMRLSRAAARQCRGLGARLVQVHGGLLEQLHVAGDLQRGGAPRVQDDHNPVRTPRVAEQLRHGILHLWGQAKP